MAGRAFGYRVLSGLCKLSLNPGSCVSGAEELFMRWGARSLVVAKFIPGFSTVGPPIAGYLSRLSANLADNGYRHRLLVAKLDSNKAVARLEQAVGSTLREHNVTLQ